MAALSDRRYIYLYADTQNGAYPLSAERTEQNLRKYLGDRSWELVKISSRDDLLKKGLGEAKALVVPGGNAASMLWGDSGKPLLSNVSEFISKGQGSYLGICAGAYLVSNARYFNGFYPNPSFTNPFKVYGVETISLPDLIGPAFDLGKEAVNLCAKTTRAVEVRAHQAAFSVLWNGGGVHETGNIYLDFPLAEYITPTQFESKKQAAILSLLNQGRVVLSSVHPELQLSQDELAKEFPHLKEEEVNALVKSIPEQEKLFNTLCKQAEI